MGSKTTVQPDHTWDEFTVRKAVPENGEDQSMEMAPARKRPAARTPSLAGVLLEAIQVASTRRGRLLQAERIREQTPLEVPTAAMRRTNHLSSADGQ